MSLLVDDSKSRKRKTAIQLFSIVYSMHGQTLVTGGQNVHLELD